MVVLLLYLIRLFYVYLKNIIIIENLCQNK